MNKVFVSYDRSEWRKYNDLIAAWNSHPDFAFVYDTGGMPAAASEGEERLAERLKDVSHILVVISREASRSEQMIREIAMARTPEIRLRFAAVKPDPQFAHPAGLPIPATAFAYDYSVEHVINALKQARNRY